MRILVDADACPVVKIVVAEAQKRQIPCLLFCDTAHWFADCDALVIQTDCGADAVDFKLVNEILPGDLVITQDYGLAAMCLAKKADVMRQDGLLYNDKNMDGLLASRHFSQQVRRAGGRLRGPKKRTSEQDEAFLHALCLFLDQKNLQKN